jgi:hypothetical protein
MSRRVGGDCDDRTDNFRTLGARLVPKNGVQLVALTPTSAIVSEKRGLIEGCCSASSAAAPDRRGRVCRGPSIVGSLGRLAEAANSIAAGRLRERVPIKGRDEFAALGRAFNKMAAQLEARWTSSRRSVDGCAKPMRASGCAGGNARLEQLRR